jgi:hypothetical protein
VLALEDCVVTVKPAGRPAAAAVARARMRDVLEGAPEAPTHDAPTARALALFVATPLLLSGGVAALLRWRSGASTLPLALLTVGALGSLVLWLAPGLRRPAHDAWMRVVRPVGRALTALLLGLVYLVSVAPVGLLMRLVGRDPLTRRLDRAAPTYWQERPRASDVEDAFRAS